MSSDSRIEHFLFLLIFHSVFLRKQILPINWGWKSLHFQRQHQFMTCGSNINCSKWKVNGFPLKGTLWKARVKGLETYSNTLVMWVIGCFWTSSNKSKLTIFWTHFLFTVLTKMRKTGIFGNFLGPISDFIWFLPKTSLQYYLLGVKLICARKIGAHFY